MKFKHICAAAAPLAMAAIGAGAQPIQVQVNGSPISFESAGPVERNNSVLVPLRGVFEALGASVDYDSSSHMVRAYRGGQNILLPIGSTQATVDGRTVRLNQPASIVGGSTMVPLRFVAESLGASVDWIAADSLVSIHTGQIAQGPPSTSYPPAADDQRFTRLNGTVARAYRRDDGNRIIRLDSGQTLVLSRDARIVMNGRDIGFGDIQPYERVAVRIDPDTNRVVRISVRPGTRTPSVSEAPIITSPREGSVIGQHVSVTGTAYPGSTVRLVVRFDGRSNDGGYAIHGTQMTRDVVTDDAGNWATNFRLNADANNLDDDTVHYTIEARTLNPDGTLSAMDSISVGGGRVYAHRRLQ